MCLANIDPQAILAHHVIFADLRHLPMCHELVPQTSKIFHNNTKRLILFKERLVYSQKFSPKVCSRRF